MFYKVSKAEGGIIEKQYERWYMLNPIACFFETYRDSLARAAMPDPGRLAYLAVVSLVVLIGGFASSGNQST